MIFLVLSERMIFLFPENMILFFRRKMKDYLSQKNTEIDAFFIFGKDGISFSCKYGITVLSLHFLQFDNTSNKFVIINLPSLIYKNLRSTMQRAGSLRIYILERVPMCNDSLYFYGDLYRRFHILFSNGKFQT